mmetsp:Transcript_63845/g.170527  ORF Transcript_63845/g.170527 Transcript_63845/m.170527 type:complete len:147 (-) Transcript_63845:298-738(-)
MGPLFVALLAPSGLLAPQLPAGWCIAMGVLGGAVAYCSSQASALGFRRHNRENDEMHAARTHAHKELAEEEEREVHIKRRVAVLEAKLESRPGLLARFCLPDCASMRAWRELEDARAKHRRVCNEVTRKRARLADQRYATPLSSCP